MPIITPAYPSMCATFNITHSSKSVIQKELEHFGQVADQIMTGKLPWKSLFVKHSFFTQDYKFYILVNAASTTKENAKIWGGFVESKIRLLVQNLERHASIQLARPFNKGYERKHKCKHNLEEWNEILDGSLQYVVKDDDSADEVKAEVKTEPTSSTSIKEEGDNKGVESKPEVENADAPKEVYTSTHYIGLELREGKSPLIPEHVPTSSSVAIASDEASIASQHLPKLVCILTPGRLTKQVRDPSICPTKSTNLRTYVSPGKSTRKSFRIHARLAFNMCESRFN